MAGGPSHLETFDPKPLLDKLNGQPRPEEFGEADYQFIQKDARLLGSARKFKKYGQSGIEVSDLFPNLAHWIDDIAVVRSCHGDMVVHSAAQYELFTGRVMPGFPSMGSWVLYGLGSESQSLPGYVVMPDPHGAVEAGQPMYANGFLPAVYQPTMFRGGGRPVRNLDLPEGTSLEQRSKTLDLIRRLNQANPAPKDEELESRIDAYDLAFRMQTEAPKSSTCRKNPRRLSICTASAQSRPTITAGAVCWPAGWWRRGFASRWLSREAVRATSSGTLTPTSRKTTRGWRPETDRPIAGLLKDLKRRGLLDSTLILWGGEFGRSPEAQGGKGRDHHNLGFTMWLAGGGIKGGKVVGATDAIGLHAVEDRYHLRDIHTTILHQCGLDQDELSFPHLGRKERLTLIQGKIIKQIV